MWITLHIWIHMVEIGFDPSPYQSGTTLLGSPWFIPHWSLQVLYPLWTSPDFLKQRSSLTSRSPFWCWFIPDFFHGFPMSFPFFVLTHAYFRFLVLYLPILDGCSRNILCHAMIFHSEIPWFPSALNTQLLSSTTLENHQSFFATSQIDHENHYVSVLLTISKH